LDHADFWFGTTIGALVVILAAEPASKALASLYSSDNRLDRVEAELKARDQTIAELKQRQPNADLLKQIAIQSDRLEAEKLASKEYQSQIVELEFRLDAARAPAAVPGGSCLEELTSIKGIKLREGEGSRQVGGRLYFGASMVAFQPTNAFCKLQWSSDVKPPPNRSNEKLLNPGEQVTLDSTVGSFQLAVTKIAKDEQGNFCLLDLVKAR
jgi:hypothetical protein